MTTITLPNLTPYVNRADYSIEVKFNKDGKDKTFRLPFMVDNQVWSQMFITSLETFNYTVQVPEYNIVLTPTEPQ